MFQSHVSLTTLALAPIHPPQPARSPLSRPRRNPQTAQNTFILGALGTIVGYLGAQVAPDDLFERLLWPQRFYNDFHLRNAAKVAFLMPMGGPMHRAALATLDACLVNGLLHQGHQWGDMLGTAFFADSGLNYTIHDPTHNGPVPPTNHKSARNAFWATVVEQLPPPPTIVPQPGDPEALRAGIVRGRTAVNLLTFSYAYPDDVQPSKVIDSDTGPITMRCLVGIVTTEITGIVVGALVLGLWRSWFCVLWWLPVVLKANSAPIRHQFRELVQLGTVIAFCFLFPLGLLCSLVWMSVELQYLWLGYQLYATVAMHFYRYSGGRTWATTGERAAAKLAASLDEVVYFRDRAGTILTVRNSRTEVDSVRDARAAVRQLLGESPEKSPMVPTGPLVAIEND